MKRKLSLVLALIFIFLLWSSTTTVAEAESYEMTDVYGSNTLLAEHSPAEIVAMYPEACSYIAGELRALNTDISVREFNIKKKDIGAIYFSVLAENPDIFYVLPTSVAMTSVVETGYLISIRPEFYFDVEDIPAQIEKFKTNTNIILSGVDQGWDDITKARYLHDMLGQYVHYDIDFSEISDNDYPEFLRRMRIYCAYGALVDNVAVCEGYTLAYIHLLKQVGITARYIQSNIARHSWAMLTIGNNRYHVDITHDDPTPDNLGRVNHDNFLKSDSYFRSDGDKEHRGWICSEEASDTSFDDYWWDSVHTIIHRYGGYDYYVNQRYSSSIYAAVIRRDIQTGEQQLTFSTKLRWNVKGMEGYFWESAYSFIASDGEYLYFNDTDNVYRQVIGSDTYEKVYTKSSAVDDDIYGIGCRLDGELYISIKESPNHDDNVYKLEISVQTPPEDNPEESNIQYVANSSGITLTKYVTRDANLILPDTVDGVKVTVLGEGIFRSNQNLVSVVVPDSVKKIEAQCFRNCGNLEKIVLPSNLTEIGQAAFYACESLTEIVIPKTVTTIGKNALAGCPDLTIKGYTGSAAQTFAKSYGLHFVALDAEETNPTTPTTPSQATQTNVAKKTTLTLYVKQTASIKPKVGTFTFSSKDKTIATVSSKGKITAKKAGKTIIRARTSGLVISVTLTVKNPKLSKTAYTMKKGKTYTLKVTGAVGKVVFKTSNSKIVAVSSKGKLAAKKKGKATIKVTANGITMKCVVTVK